MSGFKGTKYQWILSENEHYFEVRTFGKQDNVLVTNVLLMKNYSYESISKTEESKANALLISKAPEMLEMLERISFALEMFNPPSKETTLQWSKYINELIKSATEL